MSPRGPIDSPAELREVPRHELRGVADELRRDVIELVSKTGGHLAAGLGAVELATVLHYVFDTPRDKLIWDVGHQGYPHKLLTGRRSRFMSIGQFGGIGKFLRRHESEFDVFGAGHAGTSISAATGIAEAMRRKGEGQYAIAVIGDGALTAGMAYEGLNNAGYMRLKNLIVVLNDNEMSISPNVGAMSSYLARRWSGPLIRRVKRGIRSVLESVSHGDEVLTMIRKAEQSFKAFISPALLFEGLGFNYIGPIDGHNIEELLETFENVRGMKDPQEPVLVHCITKKGYGYDPAQGDPVKYHGVSKFEVSSGTMQKSSGAAPSWTRVFSDALIELSEQDSRILGITAAMAGGTGLDAFRDRFPDRFYDSAIAEQHAVTFAGGLASEGLKPVCAIYSTFLQRAYDQIVHDVCVQKLDVTFALDRAGIVGADGATHQGLYDFAYLRTLPNMIVMAPRDANELRAMLRTAIEHPGPAAVRYPRGAAPGQVSAGPIEALPVGIAELLREGDDLALIGIGSTVERCERAADALAEDGHSVAVLDARFAKPIDEGAVLAVAQRCGRVLVVEEHAEVAGFGEAVLALLTEHQSRAQARALGVRDSVVEHGSPEDVLADLGLDAVGIERAARELLDV